MCHHQVLVLENIVNASISHAILDIWLIGGCGGGGKEHWIEGGIGVVDLNIGLRCVLGDDDPIIFIFCIFLYCHG